ncbi:uncharacterized protein LOC717457 [Macaca mulatta]
MRAALTAPGLLLGGLCVALRGSGAGGRGRDNQKPRHPGDRLVGGSEWGHGIGGDSSHSSRDAARPGVPTVARARPSKACLRGPRPRSQLPPRCQVARGSQEEGRERGTGGGGWSRRRVPSLRQAGGRRAGAAAKKAAGSRRHRPPASLRSCSGSGSGPTRSASVRLRRAPAGLTRMGSTCQRGPCTSLRIRRVKRCWDMGWGGREGLGPQEGWAQTRPVRVPGGAPSHGADTGSIQCVHRASAQPPGC